MIEVSGTKAAPEANSGSRYNFTREEKQSKTPWVVGLVLVGLAAYLKSIFPSWATLQSDEGSEAPPGEDPHVALAEGTVVAPARDDLDPNPTGTVSKPGPGGSGGQIVSLNPAANFSFIPSPEIDPMRLVIPEIELQLKVQLPFFVLPANDNGFVAPTLTGGVLPPTTGGGWGGNSPQLNPGDGDGSPANDLPDGSELPDEDELPDENDKPASQDNRAPRVTGPIYLGNVYGCTAALILLDSLLANASDPDGDALAIRSISGSSGALLVDESGWWFTPSELGSVVLTYEIWDGKLGVVQTAHFSVLPNLPLIGTDGDDLLVGTECADQIDGRAGDDNIDGHGGDDIIEGGTGDDHIVGGSGDDIIRGGAGDDAIFGGLGDDQISGGDGNDRLFGDGGDDLVFGDAGDDLLFGGTGNDMMMGGQGEDRLLGEEGDDTLLGGEGCDTLDGGSGNDLLDGGDGNDELEGGVGNDLLFGKAGDDQLSGGDGEDELSGGEGHDFLSGGSGNDFLDGGEGNDELEGGVGNDLLFGKAGDDQLSGSDGEDELSGGEGHDSLAGGSGNDLLTGESGCDALSGGEGDDRLEGGAGNDALDGGEGNDVLIDGSGSDRVDGSTGDDIMIAALDGEDDLFKGGAGNDTIDYSAATSAILVDLKAETASGVEIGNDTISGFENVIGGMSDDHFIVGGTAVLLRGREGNDVFEFSAASSGSAASSVVHEILDYMVGDRIRIDRYDLFEEVVDAVEDRLEDIYGDDGDEDELPIRIRHQQTDDRRSTIVEADFNKDDKYELSIEMTGHHVLMIVEHA